MKKIAVTFLVILTIFSLLACSANTPATSDVSGVNDATSSEIMEELGIPTEASTDGAPDTKQETQKTQAQVAPTPDDVMSGGSYVVVLGDYMNSITLYYENGVLVKIVEEFQKNSTEEAECYTYEGTDVANYQFNFIDWDGVPLQDILDGMKDYGSFGEYRIRTAD